MRLPRIFKIHFLILLSIALCFATNNSFAQTLCETKLVPNNNGTGMRYGFSVSVEGDRIIAGAPEYESDHKGGAALKEWDGSTWVETFFQASDKAANDEYGYDVGISGNRIVVGAPFNDDVGSNSGSAYVYDWDGNAWNETKLTASDAASNDGFGYCVAIDGDRIVIGSFGDDDFGDYTGSVYLFEWDGSTWVETKFLASDAAAFDSFGKDVAIDGDRFVVGATGESSYTGAMYIYTYDGVNWLEDKVVPSDGFTNDRYGRAVSISGDVAVSTAMWDPTPQGIASGTAYMYTLVGSSWVENQITTSDPIGDNFGESVSLYGDRMLVGASDSEPNGLGSGSAYLFEYDGTNWIETELIVSSDNSSNHQFGYSCAINDINIAVGAVITLSNPGAVYIYNDDEYVLYEDADGDGYGNPQVSIVACKATLGYSIDNTDCDDTNDMINPGTPEICDGFDNDCNGVVDGFALCNCQSGIQTNTFLNLNANWFDPNNWSLGIVPATCHHVVIPAGTSIQLAGGLTHEAYTIDIDMAANFELQLGAIIYVVAP